MKQYSFLEETELLLERNYDIYDNSKKRKRIGSIEVRTNEGDNLKHYHISSSILGGKICVCIDKPMYYRHDIWKDHFKGTKEIRMFIDFLDSKHISGKTYFEFFVNRWNEDKRSQRKFNSMIPLTISRPDYFNIIDREVWKKLHPKDNVNS